MKSLWKWCRRNTSTNPQGIVFTNFLNALAPGQRGDIKYIFFSFVLLFSLSATSSVQAKGGNKYVGAKKCGTCHKKKTGNQWKAWKNSRHSKAFKILGTEKAKKAAKKIDVNTDPKKSKECLICHTAPKYDDQGNVQDAGMFGKKFRFEDGVQCEVCHGPGQKYYKKKVMKKIKSEGGNAGNSPTAKKTGLRYPNEKTCKRCHTPELTVGGVTYKNPAFKPFVFAERYKKIAHLRPKK